jgi:outer membrane protein assembly factor BamB
MNTRWMALAATVVAASAGNAADWPQWRGPNRDAKATDFKAPSTWPEKLTEKWKVTVGDGVATPALVGDKLYVFTRQDSNDIIRCLVAETGKEVWSDKYESAAVSPPAQNFSGPRSSPAVADGKIVTLGAHGKLSCLDAASGKVLWRKDSIGGAPRFAISSSPMIADGMCIVQFGGEGGGGITAYDLADGKEKWKWTGDGAAYASPSLITIDSKKAVVAETSASIVAVGLADGKLLWKTPYPVGKGGGGKGGKGGMGGGMGYNAATPVVDGTTIVYSGSNRGTKAVSVEMKGNELDAKELWKNEDNSVQFNSPIVRNGFVFGLTGNDKLFCINAKSGKTEWTQGIKGGGRPGYGSIVDAGSALFALTPGGELIAFEPTDKEFKQLAKYKVGSETYGYPIVTGNRIFIKDKDSVALWVVE